ncbi:hypothetical protein NC651_004630 [Populus alba x Populus x berolinensis]|nr:hypothetical protein NC651_004630 [Populus alba x Populus x berolinensis]
MEFGREREERIKSKVNLYSTRNHHITFPLLHNFSRFSSNKSKFGNLVKYETSEEDLIKNRSLNALGEMLL